MAGEVRMRLRRIFQIILIIASGRMNGMYYIIVDFLDIIRVLFEKINVIRIIYMDSKITC